MPRITVCKECTERYPGCHDKCEKYISQKEEVWEQRQKIAQNASEDNLYADYQRKKFKKYRRQV